MTTRGIGQFGVLLWYADATPELVAEIEELGYHAVWLAHPANADLERIDPMLAATSRIAIASCIVNIWTAPSKELAATFHRLEAAYPGRFLLGVGAGHPENDGEYRSPYAALVDYLDDLDAGGVPAHRRALAALGPRVLKLAADRTGAALPYLVTPEHTREARAILGDDVLLAPEHKVVLTTDPAEAAEQGRQGIAYYLGLSNYVANLRRLGFTDEDLAAPGSDRLVSALVASGTPEQVAARLREHLEAGADHVNINAIAAGGDPIPALRALAPLLGLA
ncbi:MAG: LLM class F420-dependent oxidoreductase [Mycobacteriaceae bacterium]|nr:LLM class F420-dependent oxidoreductase [Mycobacteriaceae bacterium]